MFQQLVINGEIAGCIVHHTLVNESGSVFGHEYCIFTAPKYRATLNVAGDTMRYALDVLRAHDIVENYDDMWNQTSIYWGKL